MEYDVIIIGGGPSGLMAAIAAGEKGANVLLIDKGDKLGKKLAISGGGRCNVTNRLPVEDIIKHLPGNGKFLYSAFAIFNNEEIIKFFEKLGVPLKEEDHGRMFPVSDHSQSVVNALIKKLEQLHVKVFKNAAVKEVLYKKGAASGVILRDEKEITAKAVVVAAGGKSVPHTGSTGDGYAWAEQAGHTITELYPTEVPVTSGEPFIKDKTLQGLSLRDIKLSVLNPKGKPLITHRMDMLFTHFGISGPAVLRCSQFVLKAMKKWHLKEVTMSLDVLPEHTEEMIFQEVMKAVKSDPKKSIKNLLKGYLPERYLLFLLEQSNISANAQGGAISGEKIRALAKNCKHFIFTVNGTLSFEKAFVTGGGVSIKEIEPQTMASKLMPGLYFCGEILDIHGYTGGYNITAALVTGRLAGINAAVFAKGFPGTKA